MSQYLASIYALDERCFGDCANVGYKKKQSVNERFFCIPSHQVSEIKSTRIHRRRSWGVTVPVFFAKESSFSIQNHQTSRSILLLSKKLLPPVQLWTLKLQQGHWDWVEPTDSWIFRIWKSTMLGKTRLRFFGTRCTVQVLSRTGTVDGIPSISQNRTIGSVAD